MSPTYASALVVVAVAGLAAVTVVLSLWAMSRAADSARLRRRVAASAPFLADFAELISLLPGTEVFEGTPSARRRLGLVYLRLLASEPGSGGRPVLDAVDRERLDGLGLPWPLAPQTEAAMQTWMREDSGALPRRVI